MTGMLSPSLMCANLLELKRDICVMNDLNVEFLHLDFMDGKFVPNITFGTDLIKAIRNGKGRCALDIHIMAENPGQYFDKMEINEGEIVSVHLEAVDNMHELIKDLRARGARPSIAINPDTPVESVKPYLDTVDCILLMTVYPGFAGQPLAPNSFERIAQLRDIIDKSGREIVIEVDGNVSWENAVKMRKAGADLFVAGSSSIFQQGSDIAENINKFYQIIRAQHSLS